MATENEFMLHALFIGIFITFIYDLLRIFRRVVPHNGFLVSLEDIFFWIYCTVRVFLLMHRESNGTLRWFAVMGALAGMYLYMKLVSPWLVKYVSLLLQKILRTLKKIISFLLKPFVILGRKLRERMVRAVRRRAIRLQKKRELGRRFLKKKLTYLRKMLKINL